MCSFSLPPKQCQLHGVCLESIQFSGSEPHHGVCDHFVIFSFHLLHFFLIVVEARLVCVPHFLDLLLLVLEMGVNLHTKNAFVRPTTTAISKGGHYRSLLRFEIVGYQCSVAHLVRERGIGLPQRFRLLLRGRHLINELPDAVHGGERMASARLLDVVFRDRQCRSRLCGLASGSRRAAGRRSGAAGTTCPVARW